MASAHSSPPQRVMVTGAAGFIGSNLVHWLLRNWPDTTVLSLDALCYAGNLANLADLEGNPRHRFVHGNICDARVMAACLDEVDAVINAAAQTHVDRSLMDAGDFVASNIGGVQVLMELIKERPHIRFVQVSTDEVYGSQAPGEFAREDSPLDPRNPYSATKAAADLLALAYHASFGLNVSITRCCNNFGPYHYPEKVIPLFITNLMEDQPVPLYGDGLNYREWIYVDDHCAALAAVLAGGQRGAIYNISSEAGFTNLDLTRMILAALRKPETLIRKVADRVGHDRRYALDSRKIRDELGWQAQRGFEEMLAETVRWYQANEKWWRPIKSGEYRRYYEQQYGGRAPRGT